MTVWCASCTCTPNGHLYRMTYTRCRIDTINSPDDGHMVARNMKRIEINVHEKELCVKLVIYKDYPYDLFNFTKPMTMTLRFCPTLERQKFSGTSQKSKIFL
jgi:hypothetical protein